MFRTPPFRFMSDMTRSPAEKGRGPKSSTTAVKSTTPVNPTAGKTPSKTKDKTKAPAAKAASNATAAKKPKPRAASTEPPAPISATATGGSGAGLTRAPRTNSQWPGRSARTKDTETHDPRLIHNRGTHTLEAGERPTLKTISRLTGLAVATVSRALNDAPDIGQDTKRRVQATANEIGYVPNRAGVRLRTGKTNVISLVLSTDHDVMNHTAKLISSLTHGLRHTPYHLVITPFFPGEDPMIAIRYVVETGSADGVIFNQIRPHDERIEYLSKRNFPFATHGRSANCADYSWFDFDNGRFGELSIEVLATRQRKHVMMIAPPQDQTYAIDTVKGARSVAQKLGVNFTVLDTATSDDSSAAIEAAVKAYLIANPQTDAIIACSTTACIGAVDVAENLGHVIGRDLDMFSKEAIPFLRRFRPEVLAVYEDVGAAGTFLAAAVIARINNPTEPPRQDLDIPKF